MGSRRPSLASVLCIVLCSWGVLRPAAAETTDEPGETVVVDPGDGYQLLGRITPRHSRDVKSSNWSIGAETMDRDFTVYKNWRDYLGPLGIKKARIQSGWAKTEKSPGVYSWQWLDEIVLDMVQQKVEPWVCLCYGNPIYPGGGDTGLGGGIIKSEEAFAAWERYVRAVVERYAEHIDEWELWNEPRTGRGQGTAEYGNFVARTATVVRAVQPHAKIIIAAGGSFDSAFAHETLAWLQQQGKINMVDFVTYHPYSANPDASYTRVAELRKLIADIEPRIGILQGENGCPSEKAGFGALGSLDWTESAQAKWALRRLLGDLGRDIPSSYFAICDMHYPDRVNYKGLLRTNSDKTVAYRKPSYFAVQNLAALFDNSVQRMPECQISISGVAQESQVSVFAYEKSDSGPIVTLWRSDSVPDKRSELERVSITIPTLEFRDPVWVDMVSGQVFDIADDLWRQRGQQTIFEQVPVYDSVILIAERDAVGPLR